MVGWASNCKIMQGPKGPCSPEQRHFGVLDTATPKWWAFRAFSGIGPSVRAGHSISDTQAFQPMTARNRSPTLQRIVKSSLPTVFPI